MGRIAPEIVRTLSRRSASRQHLADNVALLQYVQEGSELVRALTVPQTQAMHHHPVVHRDEITDKRFVLGDVLNVSH